MIDYNAIAAQHLAEATPEELKAYAAVASGLFAHANGPHAAQAMLMNISATINNRPLVLVAPPPAVEPVQPAILAKPLSAVMREITQHVAEQSGFTVDQLRGPSRNKALTQARHWAMAEIRATGRASLPEIGRFFGFRDHSTVIHGVARHHQRFPVGDAE